MGVMRLLARREECEEVGYVDARVRSYEDVACLHRGQGGRPLRGSLENRDLKDRTGQGRWPEVDALEEVRDQRVHSDKCIRESCWCRLIRVNEILYAVAFGQSMPAYSDDSALALSGWCGGLIGAGLHHRNYLWPHSHNSNLALFRSEH